MSRLGLGLIPVMTLAWSGAAFAQAPASPAPAAPAPAAGAAAPAPAGGAAAPAAPAQKPASTTPGAPAKKPFLGTGPFWDAVSKGDASYLARDFEAAIKAYREALEKEPNNAMGHYRLGEAMLAKGDLGEAEQSWQTGLRFCGKDEKLRAKLLFVLADLRERQKNWDEADARWKQYGQHAQSVPEARAYPATATERQKRIAEWKQLNADSLLVRERIDKRLKETEESMRKSSK
jgi:tetratricopeptide (TPR) repeat protein